MVQAMNEPAFHRLRLERGGETLSSAPTVEQVLTAMRIARSEDGLEGPPELAIECIRTSGATERVVHRLLLLLAFHTTQSPHWVIHYSLPETRGSSLLLASGTNVTQQFEPRTVCGVPSDYRKDCLIDDSALLFRAISWFLTHHGACPQLTWVPYEEAVNDAGPTRQDL
ncbi:MAG: hypothetical protein ACKOGA_24860 [Planctomycetaceae bacterium]